jgi:beta-phosphoglucomutase-like phosphatase (HAD superfamily)
VDAIADGDSVDAPKPAPDLFLFAAKQIGLEPAQCVVVEDATVGIQAAIAGGMQSIGIGPITRVGAADIVLPNLIGVHLIDLQAQLKLALGKPLQPIETAKLKVASSI